MNVDYKITLIHEQPILAAWCPIWYATHVQLEKKEHELDYDIYFIWNAVCYYHITDR